MSFLDGAVPNSPSHPCREFGEAPLARRTGLFISDYRVTNFVALSAKFPTGPVRAGIQQRDAFTTISEEAFLRSFANGVDHTKAEVLYAVQQPAAASLFGERTTAAAWHSKPSWYAVSKFDQTINPDLERFLAKRMNATTVELEAGHLSLVSHPKEIADLILILAAARRRK
jgi:pimeloyl-ACP methyl ester carboxylesterase